MSLVACFQDSLYTVSAALSMTLRYWIPKSQILVFKCSVDISNSSHLNIHDFLVEIHCPEYYIVLP